MNWHCYLIITCWVCGIASNLMLDDISLAAIFFSYPAGCAVVYAWEELRSRAL